MLWHLACGIKLFKGHTVFSSEVNPAHIARETEQYNKRPSLESRNKRLTAHSTENRNRYPNQYSQPYVSKS